MSFTKDVLQLDCALETERITARIREIVGQNLRRRGVVLGLSGGIDSSVSAALCVRALGADKVFGLHMPEGESAEETVVLSQSVSDHLKIPSAIEDITEIISAARCYERRDEAIRRVVPAYGPGWKCKVVLPSVLESDRLNISQIVTQSPNGEIQKARMPLDVYLQVVAASNFKQRTRKMIEYYHADRLNFAVIGTPNRLEYDQGFFVKNGDGSADLKPIAHLYKSQVYQLAEYLGLPEDIRRRPPTTDTYSMPQSQEEFYFSLPYDRMDVCLWALNHGKSSAETAPAVGLTADQVERVFRDIESKRRTTRYLHTPPLLMEDVPEVTHKG